MKFAIIGLGRMGHAMTLHALEEGFDVVVYNRSREKTESLLRSVRRHSSASVNSSSEVARRDFSEGGTAGKGELIPAFTIEEVVKNLESPRIVILMVPAGDPVDQVIRQLLAAGLSSGDIVIDGGNSFYQDSIRRYQELKTNDIHFLDMGTSGGIEGARYGACLMVGGDRAIYNKVEPIFRALATKDGYGYVGSAGAGHFVKVVHNGIEYGMLQAIGEGFELLKKGPYDLDFIKISNIYSHGSVIRGWLMELLHRAFTKDPKLTKIEGAIGGGQTGWWTLEIAKEKKVETPALKAALKVREESQKKPTFASKVIAALRYQFGGHLVKRK